MRVGAENANKFNLEEAKIKYMFGAYYMPKIFRVGSWEKYFILLQHFAKKDRATFENRVHL